MNELPIDQIPLAESDPLAYEVLKGAASQPKRYRTFLGLIVAPVLMGLAWWMWHDKHTVRTIGWWIFFLASLVFGVTTIRFMHYRDKLKHVTQQYFVTVSGVMGPVRESYRTEYDYSRFTRNDFEAYRCMYFWGNPSIVAGLVLLGYGFTRFTFDMYVWM